MSWGSFEIAHAIRSRSGEPKADLQIVSREPGYFCEFGVLSLEEQGEITKTAQIRELHQFL